MGVGWTVPSDRGAAVWTGNEGTAPGWAAYLSAIIPADVAVVGILDALEASFGFAVGGEGPDASVALIGLAL